MIKVVPNPELSMNPGQAVRQRLLLGLNSARHLVQHANGFYPVYQVWDNIREEEVKELEGLFRHLYRYDHKANKLNKPRGFKKLNQVRSDEFEYWG